ncbi:MAG TPA: glycosyltransferase [Burkholderiaceae bacterium]|nr:glycosyltransferase [Burkholderiaceae bacterium]
MTNALPLWAIEAAQWVFLCYFAGLNIVYIALNLVALRVIGRDSAMRDVEPAADYGAGLEPAVSLLVPAYNEEATIAASVRSMLQLEYPEFEIIVINDGSKDGTLEVLRREFALQPFPEAYRIALPVQPVHTVYRSPLHPRLRVIDKANGGKADALNAGINASRHALFCGVDADSILQRDSLRRIVQPFMLDRRVIACGGTVRIANGCRIAQGYLEAVDMPRSWLARVQIVEYLRAFLFGRLGWSPMNALLIISGAFGVFRRQAVIEAGGYRVGTIGEDMELVVRMHRLSRAGGHDYRVVFVPDPVCWTEAPESLSVLRSQRVRWQRGLLESLWANRRLLCAPRSGAVGWLAFPVMLVFEAAGPAIEVAGYLFMALAFALDLISWSAFLAFMVLAVGLGLMLSASALLLEEMSFHLYPRLAHLRALVAAMVLENLGYRQLVSWWRLVGIWRWLRGGHGVWGDMKRKGVAK